MSTLKNSHQDSLCLSNILQNNTHLSRASIINKLEEINGVKHPNPKLNETNNTFKRNYINI